MLLKEKTMTEIDTTLILKYLKDNNLTKKAFCEKCNISLYTFNNAIKNKYASDNVINNIARAMGVYPFYFTIESRIKYLY